MSKLLIIVAALNLLGTLGGGVMVFMALGEPLIKPMEKSQTSTEDFLKHNEIFKDKPILYSLDPFMVNLSNMEEDKVVLMELNIELNDEKSYEEVVSQTAAVRDSVVQILAKREYSDLSSIQGKLFLKDDIAVEVNKLLKRGLVRGIYFTKFFVE